MGFPPPVAWDSGGHFPSSWPHGNLAGRLEGKFAARRAKFGVLSVALVNSAAPPSPSHGPPGTGFPRDKRQNTPRGQQVWEQRLGKPGRNSQHGPARPRGTVCPSGVVWGGCSPVGPGWVTETSDTHPPRAARSRCPASLQAHADFSALICKHFGALHKFPAAPRGPGWLSCRGSADSVP